MSKAFDFCIPMRGTKVPETPDWLHEIKYDGYRLRVERDGDRVRLITRDGHDWTKRYPCIVESALKNRQKHFVIDGEAVILGVDIDFSQSCRWATTLEVRPGTFVPPQLRLSVFLAIHEGEAQ
jgi:ATP-dependent DNA ligase